MNHYRVVGSVMIVLLLGLVPSSSAQDLTTTVAQFVADIGAYIGTVQFEESDVQSFLQNWRQVDAVLQPEDAGMGEDESAGDVAQALQEAKEMILGASQDPQFRAWAAGAGVDPDAWMRKSMRILTYTQQRAMDESFATLDVEAEVADLESQRGAMGDEATDGMIESLRGMVAMRDAYMALPAATSTEQALLDRFWGQLMQAMVSEDEQEPAQ